MSYRPRVLAAVILGCVMPMTAAGQTRDTAQPAPQAAAALPSIDLSGDRLKEMAHFIEEYDSWKAWAEQWRNRGEPGFWGSSRKRRQPPTPPEWLADACHLLGNDRTMADGCRAWREWSRDDYAAEVIAQQIGKVRADKEATHKTLWWEHVHIDALWPMTQAGSSAYGVAGVHTTLQITRRFQIFLAPGAIMMRLPSVDGGQRWSPATHWGFSYQLLDFRFPRTHRPSTLHLNLARVWIMGQNRLPAAGEMYLAGFSITFKRSGEPRQNRRADPIPPAHETVRTGIR
jgi:hypothetical protein